MEIIGRTQRPPRRPLRYKYLNAEIAEFFAEIAEKECAVSLNRFSN